MTDGDEYIYRLGIDYRDLQKALDNVLTLLGKVDAAGLNLPTSFEKGATRASGAVATLAANLKKASGTNISAATAKQNQALTAQAAAVDKASAAYGRYQTNLARIAAGEKVARPGANSLPGNISTTQLKALSAAAVSLKANGASLTSSQSAFIAQVNAEIAARARATTAAKGEAAAVKAAEQEATAAVEAAVQKRAAARTRELDSMRAVDAQIAASVQAQRMAGSTAANLTGTGISNTRNTASANVMTYAAQAAAPAANYSALTAHYADQERATAATAAATKKANSATDAFNGNLRTAYQRTLPQTAYALSAVSRSATVAGTALIAAGVAPIAVAANYQDLYAQVERTSSILTDPGTQASKQTQYAALRQDLVDLSKQIPVTFADITKIATLGNQLGIPSADISNFTKTVAEFSATTDVDVDSAAEAFGRLGQLLDNTDYKQIGDQIAYLGVKSVATESEIINTTTQLAVSLQSLNTLQNRNGASTSAVQSQIKQTTAATLALSTTVAGLGVKPEQARGTFIRTFGAIGSAVAKGGAQLNDLARISGTSSADFAKNWSAGGGTAYSQFLKFTSGLGDNTAEINANLKSIGITAVRDRQTLGLLNQNNDRATKDYANAQVGAKNGFLDTAFAVQSQTVLKQIQVLGQQVLAVFDEIGSEVGTPLAVVIGAAQKVVGFIDQIEHNTVAATFLAIGAALSVFVGIALLAVGAVGRYASSLVYLQILLKDVQGGSSLLSSVWAGMSGNAIKAAGSSGVLAAALETEGEAQTFATGAAERAIASLEAEGTMGKKTAIDVERLTVLLTEQGVAQDVAAAAAARTAGTIATTGATMNAGAAGASKLGSAIGKIGLAGGLLALVLIIPSVVEGIKNIINEALGAVPAVDDLANSVENLGKKNPGQAESVIQKGFQAFGTAQKSAKNQKYIFTAQDPNSPFSDLVNNPVLAPLSGLGQVQNTVGQQITAGRAAVNKAAYGQYLVTGKNGINQGVQAGADVGTASTELANTDAAIAKLYNDGNVKGANKLLAELRVAMTQAGVPTKDLDLALTKTRAALGATGTESLSAAQATKGYADAQQDAQDAQDAFNESLSDLFDPTIQAQAITKDFEDIGTAVAASGAQVGLNGSEMQKAIQDIYASSTDMGIVKGRLQSVLDQLTAKGYTPAQLSGLQNAIYSIAGSAKYAEVNIDGFNQGLAGTADDSTKAATTLADYGSALASTFSRSYDLRFGNQDALDKITSGWKTLTTSISDSRDELKKAKADLAALQADKSTTEYQLGVATQFGDTARAATLRAQLAQENSDIAAKKKDVAKDQAGSSKALSGTSAGAIANRAGLEGQIQNSQSYIQSLASSGASQGTLQKAIASQKKQFIDQATAAGFSRKEVVKLARAYDDMSTIVKELPKNVTTTYKANTTPAQKALAEYLTSIKSIPSTVDTKVKLAFDPDSDPSLTAAATGLLPGEQAKQNAPSFFTGSNTSDLPATTKKATATTKKKSTKETAEAVKSGTTNPGVFVRLINSIISNLLGFETGGYTGDGPAWQAAGIVHKGEMVLNQQATKMFPRAMLEGANAGISPVIPTVNATATLGSGATMSLGTTERRLLARAGQGGSLSIRGDRIAQAFDEEFKRANRRGQN